MSEKTRAREVAQQVLEIIPIVMQVVAAELRQSGDDINPAHFHLLKILSQGPRQLSELAEMRSVSQPTMSNTITTLEVRGWVTRTRSHEDRRVVEVSITSEGMRILESIFERMNAIIAQKLGGQPEDKQLVLSQGLKILQKVFEPSP